VSPGRVGIAVFPVTERGYRLSRGLERLGHVIVHRPKDLKDGALREKVGEAFGAFAALVFVSACGIAVRAIAPHVKGKDRDPAVVVMDEAGLFAISLLSGHLGGANELAGRIAAIYGGTPVITTATDVMGLPCIEGLAGRFGLAIEDVASIKAVNSAIIEGRPVVVADDDPKRRSAMKAAYGNTGAFVFSRALPRRPAEGNAFVLVTALRPGVDEGLKGRVAILRPREFVVGIGCRRGVTSKEVRLAYLLALDRAGVSPLSVRNIATIDAKRDEAGLSEFAGEEAVAIEYLSGDVLNRVRPPSGVSGAARRHMGVNGVSEPAALISAGAKEIWLKKNKVGRVTVAVARAPFT
jgi:cobalt-precorrin 5A hydrolase